jgi:hypothetical protein
VPEIAGVLEAAGGATAGADVWAATGVETVAAASASAPMDR